MCISWYSPILCTIVLFSIQTDSDEKWSPRRYKHHKMGSLDSSTLDWSLIRAETILSLGDNEFKE